VIFGSVWSKNTVFVKCPSIPRVCPNSASWSSNQEWRFMGVDTNLGFLDCKPWPTWAELANLPS